MLAGSPVVAAAGFQVSDPQHLDLLDEEGSHLGLHRGGYKEEQDGVKGLHGHCGGL